MNNIPPENPGTIPWIFCLSQFVCFLSGISKPVVWGSRGCTPHSRRFRSFRDFCDFRWSSTQLLVCRCLSCLRGFRRCRDFRRLPEKATRTQTIGLANHSFRNTRFFSREAFFETLWLQAPKRVSGSKNPISQRRRRVLWVKKSGNGSFLTLKPSFPSFGDFDPCKGPMNLQVERVSSGCESPRQGAHESVCGPLLCLPRKTVSINQQEASTTWCDLAAKKCPWRR